MRRKRKVFLVYVDLDPVPGTMNTEESAQEVLESLLQSSIPHYNPEVFPTKIELDEHYGKCYYMSKEVTMSLCKGVVLLRRHPNFRDRYIFSCDYHKDNVVQIHFH